MSKVKKVVRRKPKPTADTTRAQIHAILNESDGEEALKRIREVLYGGNVPTTVPTTPEKPE